MSNELDVLSPVPDTLKLASGFEVALERLRTRQFFKLLRIITHGAGAVLMRTEDLFSGSNDDLVQRLLTMLLLSIPDAENEAVEFVLSMVKPAELKLPKVIDKATAAFNKGLWEELHTQLNNPELEDLIEIISAVVRREADDLQALGKKIRTMLELAKKTGQTEVSSQDSTTTTVSLEGSAEPSI